MAEYESAESWLAFETLKEPSEFVDHVAELRAGLDLAIRHGDEHGQLFFSVFLVSQLHGIGDNQEALDLLDSMVIPASEYRSDLVRYLSRTAFMLGENERAYKLLLLGFNPESLSCLSLVEANEYMRRLLLRVRIAFSLGESAVEEEIYTLAGHVFSCLWFNFAELSDLEEQVMTVVRSSPRMQPFSDMMARQFHRCRPDSSC